MKKNLLRFPEPTDAPGAPAENPPANNPAPPPASEIVLDGEITEELLQTREKLSKTEREKKSVEIRAAELEDENRQLKQAGIKPVPTTAVDTRSDLEKFMAGEEV